MKPLKLTIGVPSTHMWNAKFGLSLIWLMNQMQGFQHQNYQLEALRLDNKRGSILPKLREMIVREAIEAGSTHLLFLDSDMTFPPDLVSQLLDKDENIVACNCPTKMIPTTTTARQRGPKPHGIPVDSSKRPRPRFEPVWRIGTGVMLIRLACLKKVKFPLFEIRWNETMQDYTGEDWNFCERLEKAGVQIFVDHRASLQIGHLGELEYEHYMRADKVEEVA